MAEKNYYDILGVKKDASDADIKKRYRKLVRQYHPDVSDDPDADSKIAEINNAYETIRDKDKRAEYDAMLANPFAGKAVALAGKALDKVAIAGKTLKISLVMVKPMVMVAFVSMIFSPPLDAAQRVANLVVNHSMAALAREIVRVKTNMLKLRLI